MRNVFSVYTHMLRFSADEQVDQGIFSSDTLSVYDASTNVWMRDKRRKYNDVIMHV